MLGCLGLQQNGQPSTDAFVCGRRVNKGEGQFKRLLKDWVRVFGVQRGRARLVVQGRKHAYHTHRCQCLTAELRRKLACCRFFGHEVKLT